MNRIHWHALRLVEKLGTAGLSAIAIGLFCIAFVFISWLPAKNALAELQAVKHNESVQGPKRIASPEEALQSFFEHFPKLSERSSQIQAIMAKAKALDILVDNVSYKTDQPLGSRLSKAHVDFSVYCTYPEMRTFLNDVLTDMPFVSLDQLTINRDDSNTDIIEVRMRLTLHLVA